MTNHAPHTLSRPGLQPHQQPDSLGEQMTAGPLRRSPGLPAAHLAAHIAEKVRARIEAGEWRPGTLFPVDFVASEFGASKDAARLAVEILRDAGLAGVDRLPGDGLSHERLVRVLESRIREHAYPEGKKLPTRTSLAKEFRTSVATVTRARELLAQKGLLDKARGGYGTKVAQPPPVARVRRYVEKRGFEPGIVLSVADTAARLNLPEKSARRALVRLEEEGLLGYLPSAGFYVKNRGRRA